MGVLDRLKAATGTARRRRPALDHVARAYGRYVADAGDRLAASVALPGFLSFFPLLALAFFVLGFVLSESADAQRSVLEATGGYIPGLLCTTALEGFRCTGGQIDINSLRTARAGAGVIGIVGLLLAGTAWVDALRSGIRSVWHQNVLAGNVVLVKLRDTAILIGLGVALLASILVSGFATSATSFLLRLVDLEGSLLGTIGVKVIGYAVSIAVSLGLFVFLFSVLPKVQTPWRRVVRGALLGAVGFLLLQLLGAVYLARTTGNPIYGTFAAVIGLLIWINILCRFTLFCAAWTVTAPYDSDVAPSGTSSPEQARKAGIPVEYAEGGADDPATTVGGGAPSPLRAAVQGKAPPQGDDPGEHPALARRATAAAPDVAPTGDGAEPGQAGQEGSSAPGAPAVRPRSHAPVAHEGAVRVAGRVGVGLAAAGTAGVLVLAGRQILDAVRERD